jgi:phenylalanyl-tRNA synthetase alpha chain
MSFWLPASTVDAAGAAAAGGKGRVFHENDYCEIVREVAGDLVENVTLVCPPLLSSPLVSLSSRYHRSIYRQLLFKADNQIDDFTHPKTKRQSKCYRLNYRSMDRSLSNEEVNELQAKVLSRVVDEMGIEIR